MGGLTGHGIEKHERTIAFVMWLAGLPEFVKQKDSFSLL
jgi:hypothetical protein